MPGWGIGVEAAPRCGRRWFEASGGSSGSPGRVRTTFDGWQGVAGRESGGGAGHFTRPRRAPWSVHLAGSLVVRNDGRMPDQQCVVTVLPGVPGMERLRVDDDRTPYPDSTQDFVKVLREHRLEATFLDDREDRRYVTHKAFELWLPILQFSIDAFLALQAGILGDLLKAYLFGGSDREGGEDASAPAILHVDWRVKSSSGDTQRIVADGSPKAVLEALDRFERGLREG
jgi:hypothetical protein